MYFPQEHIRGEWWQPTTNAEGTEFPWPVHAIDFTDLFADALSYDRFSNLALYMAVDLLGLDEVELSTTLWRGFAGHEALTKGTLGNPSHSLSAMTTDEMRLGFQNVLTFAIQKGLKKAPTIGLFRAEMFEPERRMYEYTLGEEHSLDTATRALMVFYQTPG